MAGTFDGVDVKAEVLSHQDVTGVGYGVCIFEPGGENKERFFLKHQDKSAYVRLARAAIEKYVLTQARLKFPDDLAGDLVKDLPGEARTERAGAFVSVHKNGMLRGCIGTIGPVQGSIAEEIISNGISAVSRDPRFAPVTPDELDQLELSVDILGKPEDISGPDELDVKRYGVIVEKGYKRGLLLPDLDGVDTVEEQIAIAKQKAGLDLTENGVKMYRFEVVRHV